MPTVLKLSATICVGAFYYTLAAYDGLPSFIFQPAAGALLTLVVIPLLVMLGLPLHTYPPLRFWWHRHWWVAFIFGSLGFAMMASSRPSEFETELAVGGWLLTLFSVFHFSPPILRLSDPLEEEHSEKGPG